MGVLDIWLPRVVCECGGSGTIPFSVLEPYQRLWDEVGEQIGRWANLGMSLRQIQGEIGAQIGTQVGLHKLNEVVHQVSAAVEITLSSVPPVIMLDAIWMTLVEPTGATHTDHAGGQRTTKAKQEVCV
ncbi:MAG: hypothetical protein ACUVSU_01700 [Aggregatilineaceae bacterium]